jgi:subtilisin-like proprotein convertase family protein
MVRRGVSVIGVVGVLLGLVLAGTAQGATFTRDVGTTTTFSNSASIPIADGHCNDTRFSKDVQGKSDPYPSTIDVAGVSGPITQLEVTLHDISHHYPEDLRVLLVGPAGQSVMLMNRAGSGDTIGPLDDVTLTFDDSWDDQLSDKSAHVSTSYGTGFGCKSIGVQSPMPAPAPAPPYGTALSAFDATNANGQWKLYAVDTFDDFTGVIDGGWSLDIATGISIEDGECYDGPPQQTPASQYPSTIDVAGTTGAVSDVNVTLHNYSHRTPGDVRMLLVGPQGQKVLVMHHAGTAVDDNGDVDYDNSAIKDQTVTLDDAAAGPLPTPIVSGTYRPTQVDGDEDSQICGNFPATASLPGTAPAAPYSTALSAFDGTDANGTWSLYIVDDYGDNEGTLDGWSLDITTNQYDNAVLADHPAGYWRFGEASGTTAFDSSGNGNHGTYLNGPLLGQPGALALDPNTAASFDGVNDSVRVPDANSLDVGDSFTLEGWVKRASDAQSQTLFNKGGNGLQLTVMSASNGNQLWLRKANVTTIAHSVGGVPADGRFHHVVVTRTGAGNATFYIDDVPSGVMLAPAQVIADTAFPLVFADAGKVVNVFDEFALYPDALSAAEVDAHYKAGLGIVSP